MAQIKLFHVTKEGIFLPSEEVLGMNSFKNLFDEYGDNSGKVLAYLHYMCDANPETNPFANLSEDRKQEIIIRQTCPELDLLDNEVVEDTMELVNAIYETDGSKMYKAFKSVWDKTAIMLSDAELSMGGDGNMKDVLATVKAYKDLKENLGLALKAYQEELGLVIAKGGRERNKFSGKSDELS